MTISKFLFFILIFFSIIFFKNGILSHYWPVFSQLTFLPFLVWVFWVSDKRWLVTLTGCLLVGCLLDILSHSSFGFHLLLVTSFLVWAQVWTILFSSWSSLSLSFSITASGIELIFILLVQFIAKSIQYAWLIWFEAFSLSAFFNYLFLTIWFYFFPAEGINHVE